MSREVRVRPWQLVLLSIAGGAVGALIFAVVMPAQLESQMDVGIPSFAGLAQQVMPAVVNINTTKTIAASPRRPNPRGQDPFEQFFGEDFWERFGGRRGPQKQRSLGSGFVIDNAGYIVTNRHVVNGADDIDVQFSNGKAYKAKLVGEDAKTDVALLKIKPEGKLPTVPLGDSSKLQIGDWVIAVGNPFGLEHTVTAGIVSARDRVIGAGPYDDFIQTDASINPGNSGGPLFDQHGRVIGIATAIFSQSGGNIGIGFATPINLARAVVDQLRTSGKVVRGWLGVGIQPLGQDLRQALGLGDLEGALVADVQRNSPAEKAGLKRGDVVSALNGKAVVEPGALSREIAMMKPGSEVQLRVIRDGHERELTVHIGQLPEDRAPEEESEELGGQPGGQRRGGGETVGDLGLALDTLNDATRRQLGYGREVSGAVVTGVASGSPADDAGLRPGDVILQVDRKEVGNATAAARALSGAEPPILLLVRRGDSTVFVTLSSARG
ncbi:MAG: DegQ family serine endoprotease [Deltaproteobacteria bacterium]|nr:DegQ family serine endoprotease [Deltaproteobacteria bacterium]